MRFLFQRRGGWYFGFALALVSFGLVRIAFAHPSNDTCALETRESWTWVGMFLTQYVTGSETKYCVESGCAAQGGTCPSMPVAWNGGAPRNVGDQNGDGNDDFEWRWSCPCDGAWDGDLSVNGGKYCETVAVEKSWVSASDKDKTSIECIRYQCDNECDIETWTDPANPVPPNQYSRKQTCLCP